MHSPLTQQTKSCITSEAVPGKSQRQLAVNRRGKKSKEQANTSQKANALLNAGPPASQMQNITQISTFDWYIANNYQKGRTMATTAFNHAQEMGAMLETKGTIKEN